MQVLGRYIDAASFRVFADVAQNVGELEGYPTFLGERKRFWRVAWSSCVAVKALASRWS